MGSYRWCCAGMKGIMVGPCYRLTSELLHPTMEKSWRVRAVSHAWRTLPALAQTLVALQLIARPARSSEHSELPKRIVDGL